MRILVVGATGTIGRAVVAALSPRHEIVAVSRRTRPGVEIAAAASIRALYAEVGRIDAVVSAAGAARFGPLAELDDEAFSFSLANKLMGQVNLVRLGLEHVRDRGSFVLTGGVLSRSPMKGSAAISLVNAALEGFVRAAALEAPRGIRVNVVSPPWVTDTLRALGMDPAPGLPPSAVAQAYVEAVEGTASGTVIEPSQ
jgi:NAD(P)-dependent dehydrogenase (short-subunit alcohol dehydrogenase family)